MSRKSFIAAAIFFIGTNFLTANAEQPAAENYRQMFRAGNFYLEYDDKWGVRILAGKDGQRMERMRYFMESGGREWANPLGAIFLGGEDKTPEVLYRDGKFYHFVEREKADVCDEKDLDDENLDPRQGWNKITQKLALPDELAVFCWDDKFRANTPAIAAPVFKESFTKNFKGKDYDCDRYVCEIKTISGGGAAQIVYEILYRNGELFRAESYLFRNERAYPINALELKKIQAEIPEGTFKISKRTKLYAAGMGDESDLLENPRQIGTWEDL